MLQKHRQPIDCKQALNLLKTACRDALRHIDIPIIRGFSGDAPLYRLEGTQGERQSRSNEHYHTIIMDQFLPLEGYPKRSESIVCGNWLNLQYAGDYGATYAIFPFDGVPIGVTYGHDLLDTPIAMDHYRPVMSRTIMGWNELFKSMGLRDSSYAFLLADVERLRRTGGEIDTVFPVGVDVDEVLRKMYGSSRMRLQIVTPATIATIQDRQREMWFSGPCVAVRIDQLEDLKQML
jgi:hypothetical protein